MYQQSKKLLMYATLLTCSSTNIYAHDLTKSLHKEATKKDNPIATAKTHPTLYRMIQKKADVLNSDMPTAIKLYNARSQVVLDNGRVVTNIQYIGVWTDFLGDLHICKEVLADLTYEEVESLITIALAEKKYNLPITLVKAWLASFAATCAATYKLNNHYKLELSKYMFGDDHSLKNQEDSIKFFMMLLAMPASFVTKIVSNNSQKTIDKAAAKVIGNDRVIAAIEARKDLEASYVTSGVLESLGEALHLRGIYNVVFYPIRQFTDEERISYLSK